MVDRSINHMVAVSTMQRTSIWTLAIVSVALFMVTLDNLVVTNALVSIREDLAASLEQLEWTVNAYTLSYAVFLLTAAALGDRLGRRTVFAAGLAVFTVASAAAALAPSTEALIAARVVQGLGGAVVMPLSLTLLSEAVAGEERGLALGIWSGVSGLGVALGPVVGGAVVDGFSWHRIFWLNVPIGIALVPVAVALLKESRGPSRTLDLPGVALASSGLLGVVFGIVRAQELGWTSATVLGSVGAGLTLLAAFVGWELRAPAPMLPMRFLRNRGPGILTVRGGRPHTALDGDADLRGADRRHPVRPDRQPAADGRGPDAPVAGARLSGIGHASRCGLRAGRARLRDGRDRDGARVRAVGERPAELGAAQRGRPGVRRQQHHPRGRRRAGRRGAW